MRALLASLFVLSVTSLAHAASPTVTVFLERGGHVEVTDAGERVAIPAFGGGDRAWHAIVGCVQRDFAAFRIDVVDRRPAGRDFITAVIGGKASMLGLDDATTNGVGPYDGSLLRRAVVNVFSQVGTGERDVANLCAVTAHEVGHALGLDHSYECGDVMSYFLDECGPRTFMDADAPCGEDGPRACSSGARTQNSYRQLARTLGLREAPAPAASAPDPDPDEDAAPDPSIAATVDPPADTGDPAASGDALPVEADAGAQGRDAGRCPWSSIDGGDAPAPAYHHGWHHRHGASHGWRRHPRHHRRDAAFTRGVR